MSIERARFMADYFNRCGVPALALTGDSRDDVRASAQERLVRGELRVLFVVDIYNNAPPLLRFAQAAAAPRWNPKDSCGLVAPAQMCSGATAKRAWTSPR